MKKETMKKYFKGIIMICFIVSISAILHSTETKATETGVYTIKENKECKDYDIDGDGTNDSILIKGVSTSNDENGDYDQLTINVNGKTALTRTNLYPFYGVATQLIKNEKHSYFLISLLGDNDYSSNDIYEYTNGVLKKRANVNSLLTKAAYQVCVTKVNIKANKITLKITSQTDALAHTEFSIIYKIDKQGKLSLSPKTYKVKYSNTRYNAKTDKSYTSKYLVTQKKIQIYKKANTNKKAFIVKKGEKLTVSKLYLGGKKAMYYCKTKSGKKGWFVSKTDLFKDLSYAG